MDQMITLTYMASKHTGFGRACCNYLSLLEKIFLKPCTLLHPICLYLMSSKASSEISIGHLAAVSNTNVGALTQALNYLNLEEEHEFLSVL